MAGNRVVPIELKEEELLELSDIIYRKEVLAIYNIQFKSEQERSKYLRDIFANKTNIEEMLKSAKNAMNEHQSDQVKGSIAHDLYHYSLKCVNTAIQTVFRSFPARQMYLAKIKGHSEELLSVLRTLGEEDVAGARALAETAAYFKDASANFFEKSQSWYSSKSFSKMLKQKGVKFPDLIRTHQAKLGFKGNFKDLKDTQKLQVYNKIIEVSGRGRVVLQVLDRALAYAGTALLVFALGAMVWDIFVAEHPLEVAIRDGMSLAVSVGSSYIGGLVAAELIPALFAEVEINAVFLACAGFLTGLAAGFIIAAVAGVVLEMIFSSGGDTPPPHLTDGHICYVAPLPDGAALAHELMYGIPSN